LPDAVPAAVVDPAFLDLGTLAESASNQTTWDIELELGAGVVLRLRRG
jgi:hypothetical protein